jgi:hypothetical protein
MCMTTYSRLIKALLSKFLALLTSRKSFVGIIVEVYFVYNMLKHHFMYKLGLKECIRLNMKLRWIRAECVCNF